MDIEHIETNQPITFTLHLVGGRTMRAISRAIVVVFAVFALARCAAAERVYSVKEWRTWLFNRIMDDLPFNIKPGRISAMVKALPPDQLGLGVRYYYALQQKASVDAKLAFETNYYKSLRLEKRADAEAAKERADALLEKSEAWQETINELQSYIDYNKKTKVLASIIVPTVEAWKERNFPSQTLAYYGSQGSSGATVIVEKQRSPRFFVPIVRTNVTQQVSVQQYGGRYRDRAQQQRELQRQQHHQQQQNSASPDNRKRQNRNRNYGQ